VKRWLAQRFAYEYESRKTRPKKVFGYLVTKKLAVFFPVMLLASIPIRASAVTALGRVEVLGLLAGGAPAAEVAGRVQRDGINFRADEEFLALIGRAEAANDPGKEQLTKILSTASVVGPISPEPPKEQELLEHLAHGAELSSKIFAPDSEEYRVAEHEFREALEINPENPVLHFALGDALGHESKFDMAIAEFRTTLGTVPDLCAAHLNLGRALAGKGDLDNALTEFREAVRLDPASTGARILLAKALLEKRDAGSAVQELREGLRLQPDDASLHNTLGTVLYTSGDVNSGIAEFWHAIRLGSKDPDLYTDLAYALRRKGDLDGAIAELREAVRLDPNSFQRHYGLGMALVDKGDLPGASAEYREAIRLKPDHALSHSELGYGLKKQHDLDGAIAEYREAIRLDPKLAVAHSNLAAALYAKGQHEAGYEEVLTAHELAPNDPSISAEFQRLPERYKQRASQPAQELKPPAASLGEPETLNFLYYVDAQNGSDVPLEAETPTLGASGSALGFGGAKGYISVIGERSPVRLKAGSNWEFVIRPADPTVQLNFRFERFEAKAGSRMLSFKKKLVPSRSSDKPGLLMFNASTFGKSSLELTVPYNLAAGEYGFFVSAKGGWKMFCFGVDTH